MCKVSIIVPTYNNSTLISKTLENILEQSYENWECIIVDDGSTDNTLIKIKTYLKQDHRFKYFYKSNGGLSSARNFGIRNASGKYIQFLDSDDYLQNDKLLNQVKILEDNPSVDIVYTEGKYFESHNEHKLFCSMSKDEVNKFPNITGKEEQILNCLVEKNIMPVNAALLRKGLINKVGLFDEEMNALEDWDYWIRCASESALFKHINYKNSYPLIRIHNLSMSNDNLRMQKALIQLRLKHDKTTFNKYTKFRPINRSLLKKDAATPYFMNLYHKKLVKKSLIELVYIGMKYNCTFYNISRGLMWLLKRNNE